MAREDDDREDDDREVQDTTLIRGETTHAWSAVDRPGTDPSDPRPQGPDTGEFDAERSYPVASGSDQPGVAEQMTELTPVGPGPYGPLPVPGGPPGYPGGPGPEQLGPPQPPGPVLVATGLGLLGKSGWVFQNIDLTLRPTSVAAIVGPSGTGRSSLLLALAGRLRPTAGSLSLAGHSYHDKPSAVRQLAAIARVGSIGHPEPALTVREYIAERCLLEDVGLPEGRTRFAAACDALQLAVEPSTQVGALFGDKATLFAVAAACVRVSAVIMLDDLDRGVSGATQQLLLDALLRLAMTGPTIIVTTTDRIPVMEADAVLDLTPTEGAALWQFDRNAPLPGPVLGELGPGLAPGPGEPPPDDAPTTVLPPQPEFGAGPADAPDDTGGGEPDEAPPAPSDESTEDRR